MKVLLVGNYEPDGQQSMLRFADMLEAKLPYEGIVVTRIAPQPVLLPGLRPGTGIHKWVGYLDKFAVFPFVLRAAARRHDVVHVCDHSNAMYLAAVGDLPHLITCHDVIAVQAARGRIEGWRVGFTGRTFQRLILRGLRRARAVAAVSELTAAHLTELAPEARDRITVVHNGLNDAFRPMQAQECLPYLQRAGLKAREYFIHVGSALPRKNRPALVRMFARLREDPRFARTRLAMVGGPLDEPVRTTARACGVADRLVSLPDLDNAALAALYSQAIALLYPSLHEGFGWPVIEAQACGCPVFCSDRAPMSELCGASARYFDPLDPDTAATAIAGQIDDSQAMTSAGLANAARFTAAAMALAYARLYRERAQARGA